MEIKGKNKKNEKKICRLFKDFKSGRGKRGQLIQSLSVAASTASIVGSVPLGAAEGTPVKVTKINHISYRVANYAKTRDFYSGLLGMKTSDDDGKEKCSLAIGDLHIHVN